MGRYFENRMRWGWKSQAESINQQALMVQEYEQRIEDLIKMVEEERNKAEKAKDAFVEQQKQITEMIFHELNIERDAAKEREKALHERLSEATKTFGVAFRGKDEPLFSFGLSDEAKALLRGNIKPIFDFVTFLFNRKDSLRMRRPMPSGEAPSGEAPSGEAPSGEAPSGEAPSGEAPSGEAPSGEAPSGEAPSGEAPSGEAPSGEAPSGEAPSGEAPSGEAPSGEAPSGEAPSGEAPSGEAPSGEAPSGEAPSGEAPSDETFTTDSSLRRGFYSKKKRS